VQLLLVVVVLLVVLGVVVVVLEGGEESGLGEEEGRKEGTASGAWLGGQGGCSRARLVCGFLCGVCAKVGGWEGGVSGCMCCAASGASEQAAAR